MVPRYIEVALILYFLVIVRFDVSDEEAKALFSEVKIVKPYLRFTSCPKN